MGKKPDHPTLFAVVPPGLEGVAADELRRHRFRDVTPLDGGVRFRGNPLKANRILAIPTRILQRVARFEAPSFDALEAGAMAIDWAPFGGLTPQVTCTKSRLYHSGAVAERLAAIVPPGDVTLRARLHRDRCTLSVDTSGERLHQRGWRLENGPAPMRETLAAAMLALAGWAPGEALFDPMCGSGTLLIEAAGAAAGLAPGRLRTFACEAWWRTEAMPRFPAVPTMITGRDQDAATVAAARRNAERAGVEIAIAEGDAADATPPAETGLLVCNPPYGKRAEGPDAFRALGALLKGPFAGWRAAILCPRRDLEGALGRRVERRVPLRNGGLKVDLLVLPAG
ncbi:MAG: methyltransferase [Myxococcales bacterium]|nr:methyltransferase [Myxococcales bacterium]